MISLFLSAMEKMRIVCLCVYMLSVILILLLNLCLHFMRIFSVFFKFGFICYNNEFSYPILFPLKWYKGILSGFKFGLLFKFFNHMHLD